MNKTALRNFAINARKELLEKVTLQARKLGITKDTVAAASIETSDAVYIDDKLLDSVERKQRNKLIARIDEIGFDQVVEETAYTWFNRFAALRFMEVNDYLPTRVRVLSSESEGSTEPDMIREALSLNLPIDKEHVYNLKVENDTDKLFKYLIKLHCNDLNRYMPFMFETIEDYTEILFPEGLLSTDSFVKEMIDTEHILEEDWRQVEIIGWLYQYYIYEENDRVIRAKKRYKKEEIPFATQLFTPEWIVQYMVQNALGRYWVEAHPEDSDLIDNWEFYLESQEPKAELEEKLTPFINKQLRVEDITCFDPAMGSGHILVYMFDVLYEIYSKSGYMEREIPRLIIENNLYGLDIDDRAYQLASFSVVMKALQYNRRFLRSIERDGLTMNLAAIQETNLLTDEEVSFLAGETSGEYYNKMKAFIDQFEHAKAIGSLIKTESLDLDFLNRRIERIEQQEYDMFELDLKDRTLPLLYALIKQAKIMSRKYDVFITNPPYAGNRYLPSEIRNYLEKSYSYVKMDLFSAFIDFSFSATKKYGQIGFMSPYVWMFISAYEKLRMNIIDYCTISSLVQLEYSGFDGATVPICTFTLRNYNSDIKGGYIQLSDFKGSINQPIKVKEAASNSNVKYLYSTNQNQFSRIPGLPIVYWLSQNMTSVFGNNANLNNRSTTKAGVVTGKDTYFIRFWYEVNYNEIKKEIDSANDVYNQHDYDKYHLFSKGGPFRRYYGNLLHTIKLNDLWNSEKFNVSIRRGDPCYYFKKAIGWSLIGSGKVSFRVVENSVCGTATQAIYLNNESEYLYVLGFLNSKVSASLLDVFSQTLNLLATHIGKVPFIINKDLFNQVSQLTKQNITLTKLDWDAFEISLDFEKHPLMKFHSDILASSFKQWKTSVLTNFNQLQKNEEELNRIFIEIYGLQDELTPDVADEDVTINKADLERDIKSFISYAVGCTFGRYSLDEEGLIYAGGEFDPERYQTFPADENNILPILPGAYFEDDIVTRFITFVETTYGKDTLEENLDFVADAIGKRKNETSREAIRRYFLNNFYKDHLQTYKKRPIYWLFTSGKEKAFNCLIYMHRYDKTTLSRIRTDYLHDVQVRYETERKDLLTIIEGDASAKEIRDAKKQLTSVEKKIEELKKYDEKLHHLADQQIEIDLDDGVDVNYEKFKGLVAKR